MDFDTDDEAETVVAAVPERDNAARCRRWNEKRRSLGLVRVTVEVPSDRAADLRAVAAAMRDDNDLTANVGDEAAAPAGAAAPEPLWRDAERRDWTRR